MAAKKMKLSALWGMKEGTFATDPDTDGSDYKFLKSSEMSFTPEKEVIELAALVADITRLPHVMGAKGGKLSFKLELKGSGTAAIIATPAIAPESDAILETALGTVARGTGSTVVAAGSTTTVVNVTSAAGMSKYMMLIFNCGATYGYVPRFVASIATNAVTLDRALPAVPANGAAVQASNKYTRANSGHGSMAFVAKHDDIEYTLLGCKIDSIKITTVEAGKVAMLDLSYSVTDWTATTKGSLPTAALSGITAISPPVVKGSCFAVDGVEEPIYSFDFDVGSKFEFQDSTCALGPAQPDAINAGLEMVDADPSGTVKAYYAAAHMTDFAAGTERSLAFAAGAGSGNAWGFFSAKNQWQQPAFEDHKGMVGQTMQFKVNDNSTDPEYVLCLA